MHTYLILPEVGLVDDIEGKLPSSVIFPVMLDLFSHVDVSRFILLASSHCYLSLSSEQLIEGYIGICEEFPLGRVVRPLLFPYQHLEVGIM